MAEITEETQEQQPTQEVVPEPPQFDQNKELKEIGAMEDEYNQLKNAVTQSRENLRRQEIEAWEFCERLSTHQNRFFSSLIRLYQGEIEKANKIIKDLQDQVTNAQPTRTNNLA
jgi:hypothetical protein